MGIMKRRRAGYEARQNPVHRKIGRDDKLEVVHTCGHNNDRSKKNNIIFREDRICRYKKIRGGRWRLKNGKSLKRTTKKEFSSK